VPGTTTSTKRGNTRRHQINIRSMQGKLCLQDSGKAVCPGLQQQSKVAWSLCMLIRGPSTSTEDSACAAAHVAGPLGSLWAKTGWSKGVVRVTSGRLGSCALEAAGHHKKESTRRRPSLCARRKSSACTRRRSYCTGARRHTCLRRDFCCCAGQRLSSNAKTRASSCTGQGSSVFTQSLSVVYPAKNVHVHVWVDLGAPLL
jgi:hypothetical protein